MAKIDDPKGWILQLFRAEEREGRGGDCELFPDGIVPPDLPLRENEKVYGVYKGKYHFTPESFIVMTPSGYERIPWAMICNCTSQHGEARKTARLTLTDGRTVRVNVGDFAVGWRGRISQLFHQMIERWGARAVVGPQPVPVAEFFKLSLTEGGIGCNLLPHPGINAFREVLEGLTTRQDVEAVYALVSEPEPEEKDSPFTDTVLVFGTVPLDTLRKLLAPIQPDWVGPAETMGVSSCVLERHQAPALVAWWD